MVQSSIIGIVGTALGVLGGVCLALNIETLVPILEQLTHHQFLAPDVYYISDLPSQLNMSAVIRIGGLSLAPGLLSTLYPAWRASRVSSAEAARSEERPGRPGGTPRSGGSRAPGDRKGVGEGKGGDGRFAL